MAGSGPGGWPAGALPPGPGPQAAPPALEGGVRRAGKGVEEHHEERRGDRPRKVIGRRGARLILAVEWGRRRLSWFESIKCKA